jgi:uncharacterized membrane protein
VTSWASALLRIHLACALGAGVLFWVAAFLRKGEARHRAIGRWFARLMYGAAATGALLAVAELTVPFLVRPPDPSLSEAALRDLATRTMPTMWLALYVLLIIVAPVQHGVAAVSAGPAPRRMRSAVHATLNTLAILATIAFLPASIAWQQPLYLVVAPIGFIVGLRNLGYAARSSAAPVEWQREHLTSMLTAGITLHTALFVFGTSRTLKWALGGWTQLLPWTLPAVIGLLVIALFRRRGRPWTTRHV